MTPRVIVASAMAGAALLGWLVASVGTHGEATRQRFVIKDAIVRLHDEEPSSLRHVIIRLDVVTGKTYVLFIGNATTDGKYRQIWMPVSEMGDSK